ncbi:MAG TPA: hypothetical protein VEA69_21360 [Tepidisphaeraceae bacterium]|nr:hypothetical protein [Tepidisphaeraceae bacterium]
MFRRITVLPNQRLTLQDAHGRVTVVDGPARVRAGSQVVSFLERQTAGPTQYLVVHYLDGRIEHVRGPASVWVDPLVHRDVETADATPLDANQAVVVYRQEDGGAVARRIVRGPELFVPGEREWLHQFSWHGADPTYPGGGRKIAHALRFTKLRIIPDQMYLDVEEVRTADDALLTVRLMIFFELTDIERMLDRTHDPVADFVNAATADVLDFAAARTFELLKTDTAKWSELAAFPQLVTRSESIGYRIGKVVFRGYAAGAKLQAMHDGAIETRTQLRLAAETERQAQALADFKQRREVERAEERRQAETSDAEHKRRLAAAEHEDKRRRVSAEHEDELTRARAQAEARAAERRHADAARAEARQAAHRDRAAFLQALAATGVDLTRYLTAGKARADRTIRITGTGGRTATPQVHVHDRAGNGRARSAG